MERWLQAFGTIPWYIAAGSVGAGALTLGYGIFAPGSSLFCPVITRADSTDIALTFDDGPWPNSTDPILDHLAAARARATFFVIGEHARRWPELLRRIDAEGHVVANHTATHSYGMCLSGWTGWRDELTRTDDMIERVVGKRPRFFRPPMGFKTWNLARAARDTGHRVVAWSRRALDGVPTTPDRIVHRLEPALPGEILALHDGIAPCSRRATAATVDALPRLLNAFGARGLRAVGLDTLLGVPAYRVPAS